MSERKITLGCKICDPDTRMDIAATACSVCAEVDRYRTFCTGCMARTDMSRLEGMEHMSAYERRTRIPIGWTFVLIYEDFCPECAIASENGHISTSAHMSCPAVDRADSQEPVIH